MVLVRFCWDCWLDYLTLVQVGDCWNYALEANNKLVIIAYSICSLLVLYHARTMLIGNINMGVILRQSEFLASLFLASSLVKRWSRFPDHGYLYQLTKRSYHWLNDVMNIPNIIIVMRSSHFELEITMVRKHIPKSFDREIIHNHHLLKLSC